LHQSDTDSPGLGELVQALWSLGEAEALPATLMGLGPMSPNVIQAALEAGRDWDLPVILIASRNQIEARPLGGGYLRGWDQRRFREAIHHVCDQISFTGLCYVCRDHGGPWQRDEEYHAKLPLRQAMARAIASYQADLAARFDLLHIDPTKDPFSASLPDLAVVADCVVELIAACEQYRAETGAPRVCYEVGTEETVGGLTSPEAFESFLVDLLERLEAAGLPRPTFIVGQTGTLIKMRQNLSLYDPARAQQLVGIARRHGLAFKEHNCDYLPTENLAQHPAWGITGANFGPSAAHAETLAYLALAEREAQVTAQPSGFGETLAEAAFACGRWRKWLLPEHEDLDDKTIRAEAKLFEEVVSVAGHYVLDEPAVVAARQQMYQNLEQAGAVDCPQRYVIERIKALVGEYAKALGLVGITSRLREVL